MPDPIKGRPIQPGIPIQPARTEPDKPVSKKTADFKVSDAAEQKMEQVVREQFESVASRIRDGVGRGLDKQAILHDLAEHELSAMFGKKASGRMVGDVAEAISNDPNLSRLYDKLYTRATAAE